jgi:hypothetical protein
MVVFLHGYRLRASNVFCAEKISNVDRNDSIDSAICLVIPF